MFLGDSFVDDAARRSGLIRSAAARSGMRGLGSSCCSDCAAQSEQGLGDLSSIATVIEQSKALDWLFVLSLSIGAVAGGLSIYDHMKKRRRFGAPRRTARTMQIPTQTMHDLVYGED